MFNRFTAFLTMACVLFAASDLTPAAADEHGCTAWQAAMQQREEGAALTATACAKTRTHDAILEIVCFGEKANIRYIHAPGRGAEEFGPKRDFVFITNKARRHLFMTFEGLDGAFTAYLDTDHPLFEMLMEGSSLSIEDPTRHLDSRMLTLKNSREAIGKVVSGCEVRPVQPVDCAQTQATREPATQKDPAPAAQPANAPAGGATPRTSGATGPSEDKR